MPHFRAFGVGGEVQAASRRLIGDRMHGITDRTSGVVAAEQKRSVVRTHEVRDLRRVEYWRNFHETASPATSDIYFLAATTRLFKVARSSSVHGRVRERSSCN